MKNEQMSMMDEVDRFEKLRNKRMRDETIAQLDAKYKRITIKETRGTDLPAGLVVIIAQDVMRDNVIKTHFYRAVLGYHNTVSGPMAHLVEAQNEEWPDVPPWATTIGHEKEPRNIGFYYDHLYWNTGEIVEPIKLWWM